MFEDSIEQIARLTGDEPLRVSACLRERYINKQEPVLIIRRNEPFSTKAQEGVLVVVWEDLLSNFPTTPSDRFDRTLLNLAQLLPKLGQSRIIDADFGSVAFAEDDEAMFFVLNALEEAEFIKTAGNTWVNLTALGWSRVGDLKRERGKEGSKQAFVAMMASGEWQPICDAIKKGIEAAGYAPYVVMEVEHSQKIDDLIIGEIRRSHFIVADFTGHRQSVYFEVGLAFGLNLPIIWTCRSDQIRDAHFDTRQYNHIVWDTPEELSQRLTQRIRAVVL